MENKQLLEIQTEYLSKKNPIYRNQYKEYFESSLKTDLIIVIE
jgi:hypothetical protein